MKKRAGHLNRYRSQLRDALGAPGLTDDQKATIKSRLKAVGQEKPYAELAAKRQGVSSGSDSGSVPDATDGDLSSLSKDALLSVAASEGVDVQKSWTKAKIAKAIQAARG